MAVPHDTLWAWALSACLLSGLADPATGSPAPAPKTQAAAAPKTPAAPGAFISEGTGGPWPAPVPGFVPPQPGEHPRLFFRKADLPALKARAKTPEGQAILARLRVLLGGGEALPTVYNQNTPVNIGAKGAKEMPLGAYTLWHGAGFGFLYQITGDKKYADLARQCVEKAIDGQVDRDERYNWTTPGAGLRVGPCLSGIAMAYDFCYDAWDDTFRRRVVKELVEYSHTPVNFGPYNEGAKGPVTLERLVAKPYMPPQSNHYGAFTGGTGIALLAVKGDPGTDDQLVSKYLDALQKNMITLLTQGFGDHGYFAEGPGPSHMSVNTGFVPLLQAMKVAGGKDFITPRPNGQWLTLRWVMEIVPREGTPYYPCRHPSTYGTELVARDGMSDGGEFCQGFGAIPEALKPALLWTYAHFVEPGEVAANPRWLKSGQISYDATVYPHRAVLAFINWPIGTPPRNPAELLPRVMEDKARGYYVFRNQWKDENDIVVTAFLDSDSNHGYVKSDRGGPVMVWGLGLRTTMPGAFKNTQAAYFRPRPDGSAVLSAPNNGGVCSLAVDFSGAAGVPALIVQVGPMGDKGKAPAEAKAKSGATARTTTVSAGGQAFAVMTLQAGPAPEVRVDGDKVIVGGQTISFDGAKLVLAKW